MSAVEKTLAARFAELQAERARTWDPALLQANAGQRRRLVEAAATRRIVAPGDRLPDVSLRTANDGPLSLRQILEEGPAVLVFFRFATCPACNIALSHYEQSLLPGLTSLGVRLMALSPQIPQRVQDIVGAQSLSFPVLTDPNNELARSLGLTFEPTENEKSASLARGSFIGDTTGTGTWELPMPGIVLAGRDRVVHFVHISPDWLDRSEAGPVLEAARLLAQSRAA